MGAGYGKADRSLTTELVARIVGDQFPELRGGEIRVLGAGWDNELFTVDGEWIFRFPKRAERVPWLLRETAIMPIVAGALGPAVPRIEYVGAPDERFPYPFTGYRLIHGTGADQVPRAEAGLLAGDLGRLLNRLHRISPASIPPTPDAWEQEPGAVITADLVEVADTVAPLLSGDLLGRAEPYLAGAVPQPPRAGQGRFVHNDICPDHVLVDRHSGRLAGLIDWTDAMIGDPVADFTGLIGISGFPFIHQVVAHYDLPLDDTFAARLEWRARTLTLTWLAEAASDNPGAIGKHLSWVRRAFAG